MAGDNLLHQGGPAAGHARYKYQALTAITTVWMLFQQLGVKAVNHIIGQQALVFRLIVEGLALQSVTGM